MKPQLQTVKDLATLFHKHENTIYRWITEDKLFPNAFRVKDGWYVPTSDVEALMRSGRLNGTESPDPERAKVKPVRDGFVRNWQDK